MNKSGLLHLLLQHLRQINKDYLFTTTSDELAISVYGPKPERIIYAVISSQNKTVDVKFGAMPEEEKNGFIAMLTQWSKAEVKIDGDK